MASASKLFLRRKQRVRFKVKKVNRDNRLRFSVFRSSRYIYAQLIDDKNQKTVASASSLEKDLRSSLKTGADCQAAACVGKRLAERALQLGVTEVVFDRGPYIFHGRVQALANAAREAGLSF